MRDPLRAYLGSTYILWYVPLLAFGVSSATNLGSSFVYALGPLAALVSPLALCGVAFTLKTRREIEALQTYGVSFRRFCRPLSIAAAVPTAVTCLVGIAVAPRHALAAAIAALAAVACSGAFALVARRAWRSTLR